jgi:hypothetical protein
LIVKFSSKSIIKDDKLVIMPDYRVSRDSSTFKDEIFSKAVELECRIKYKIMSKNQGEN